MTYMDHAATTPDGTIPGINIEVKSQWDWNPHSVHELGRRARKLLKTAEETIKEEINGHKGEIIWTGSGSQANNLALQANNIVTTQIEHKSIRQHSSDWNRIPTYSDGTVMIQSLASRLPPSLPLIISIQMVNNVTGIIQPVDKVAEYKEGVYFHIDAVQAFKKIEIDVEALQCDMMSLSAHKIYGPKGIGCLWVRKECLEKLVFPYQGTPSVELADRFAYAIQALNTENYYKRQREKENIFLRVLNNKINTDYYIPGAARVPGLFTLIIPGIDQERLLLELDSKRIYVSLGSACSADKSEPNYVLEAMKIPDQDLKSSIRISLGDAVTIEEVKTAAKVIAETIEEIQHGSQPN